MSGREATPLACRCRTTKRLEGDDALHQTAHLRLVDVAADGWSARWVCPPSGAIWHEIHHVAWSRDEPSTTLVRVAVAPAAGLDGPGPPMRRLWSRSRWRLAAASIPVLLAITVAFGTVE